MLIDLLCGGVLAIALPLIYWRVINHIYYKNFPPSNHYRGHAPAAAAAIGGVAMVIMTLITWIAIGIWLAI